MTESLQLATQAGDRRAVAAATNNLGVVQRARGRLAEADRHFHEARAAFDAIEDRRGTAAATCNLATTAFGRGDYDTSRRRALEALRLYDALDLVEGQLDALDVLVCLEALAHPATALDLLAVTDAHRAEHGDGATPDERMAREAARASALRAVGDRSRSADPTESVADVVRRLLHR